MSRTNSGGAPGAANDPHARAPAATAAAAQALRRGEAWLDRGDYAAAERCFADGLRLAPDDLDLLRGRAIALHHLRRPQQAIALLGDVVARRPDDAPAWNALGSALGEHGDLAGAAAALRRACELEPGFAAGWFNLGKTLNLLGRVDASIEPLRRALAIDPGFASAHFLLAEAYMALGRTMESAAQYRRLLDVHPRSGLAWWGLANLKSVRLDDADVAALEALLARGELAGDEHIAARFALAKALDDRGRAADAFAAYVAANALARGRFRWNSTAFRTWLARTLAAFAAPAAPLDASLGAEAIFLVGLPRSGSTLTEQILAAHPQVEGAGELPDLGQLIAEESRRRGRPFPDWVAEAGAADWQRLGRDYLARTARWRTRRPRSTDKAPGNWVLIGAIRAMLPGARIVDCRRDPVETCWSCFRQIFWAGHEYSYDLADLADYWHAYDEAMRVWQARAPGRIRTQVYEALQAEPEAQTRALLDFCGLPFDAACLRFHEAERSVMTASAAQVREPLRRDTARAPRYGALLEPLRRALAR
ncbi:MAG TPA: sulfotransferase [Dokdonella sp.]